jgi:CheY-like chemotaxis protein
MHSILYVDDEPDLLELGRIFLEETKEFTVRTFGSAVEALDFLAWERVDAIVSDYQMLDMDGIQFLVEMRKRFGPDPIHSIHWQGQIRGGHPGAQQRR